MAKRDNGITTTLTDNGNVLTFNVPGVGTIPLIFNEITPEIRHQLMVHGARARIGDAAAKSRDKTTGASASPQDKFDAMRAVAGALADGRWSVRVAGEARDTSRSKTLLLALIAVYPQKSREQLVAFIAAKTGEQLLAMELIPAIKTELDRIRAERVADVDTDELMAGLDDEIEGE